MKFNRKLKEIYKKFVKVVIFSWNILDFDNHYQYDKNNNTYWSIRKDGTNEQMVDQ